MKKHQWKDEASCLDYDTNIFFDKYEEDKVIAKKCEDYRIKMNKKVVSSRKTLKNK